MCDKKFKKGDIVFVQNICETKVGIQTGSRPYLIVSNNKFNTYSPVLTCVPLTTKAKKYSPVHYFIEKRKGLTQSSIIMCEQIQTVAKEDIERVVCTLPEAILAQINKLIMFQLAL